MADGIRWHKVLGVGCALCVMVSIMVCVCVCVCVNKTMMIEMQRVECVGKAKCANLQATHAPVNTAKHTTTRRDGN